MLKNRRESIVKIGAGIAIGIIVSFGSIGIVHNVDSGGYHSANVTRMNVHASHHYEPRTFHKNIERKRFFTCNKISDSSSPNREMKQLDTKEKTYMKSVKNLKDYTVSVSTLANSDSDVADSVAQVLTFNRKPNVPNAKLAN